MSDDAVDKPEFSPLSVRLLEDKDGRILAEYMSFLQEQADLGQKMLRMPLDKANYDSIKAVVDVLTVAMDTVGFIWRMEHQVSG
jgi:hypothetical protein